MNNLDLSPVLKRVGAYMIDILITLIIATILTSLPFLNTRYQKYQKAYNEYQEVYNDYNDTLILLDDSFKDKNITKEEYDKLSTSKIYSSLFESFYEDEVINEDEYNKAKKEIDKIYTDTATDYNYRLQKLGIYNSIITLATTFIYFGIIQFFLKGQTVGKKLLHLQVTSANDKVRFHKKTIRQVAEELRVPYYMIKGDNFEEDDFFIDWLKRMDADVFCVISFKKLPKEIIKLAKKCAFNIHASLLPFLRGAAPINWAISSL